MASGDKVRVTGPAGPGRRTTGPAHGTHRYTAEEFGLSTAQLRSDYDFYIRHFDVAVEG